MVICYLAGVLWTLYPKYFLHVNLPGVALPLQRLIFSSAPLLGCRPEVKRAACRVQAVIGISNQSGVTGDIRGKSGERREGWREK